MINQDYLYTSIYKDINDFVLEEGSTYIYGHSPEYRSHLVENLIGRFSRTVNFVKIEGKSPDLILDHNKNKIYSLKSSTQMNDFIESYSNDIVYIDTTGLNNRQSAPILKSSITFHKKNDIGKINVIYVEPQTYKIKEFKAEGVFNDLSESIEGISPLPGFASIIPDNTENIIFVALLGFEGGRFTHLIESIQPKYENIFPIIGLPGFRPEYPFVAFWGNRKAFEETNSWRQIKFASANSIVDAYQILKKILEKNPRARLKIAPIGTKPHAIAAMLFAIKNEKNVEIIYDNPKRNKKRTDGVGLIVECSVSKLIEEN